MALIRKRNSIFWYNSINCLYPDIPQRNKFLGFPKCSCRNKSRKSIIPVLGCVGRKINSSDSNRCRCLQYCYVILYQKGSRSGFWHKNKPSIQDFSSFRVTFRIGSSQTFATRFSHYTGAYLDTYFSIKHYKFIFCPRKIESDGVI